MTATARSVLEALDKITKGRVVMDADDYVSGSKPFVVTKSSHLPGKAITETPGLVCGRLEQKVEKIGVCMTLSELDIELAGAMGLDAIIAHHPVADAANSGGVPLRGYLGLYGLTVFELHEAFHGLHPGIPYLHGHKTVRVDVQYGGIPGNIVFIGQTLPEIKTLQDVLDRLARYMGRERELALLSKEQELRCSDSICETSIETAPAILFGEPESKVETVLHIFPHTGFSPAHMEQACSEHKDIDFVIASISRVKPDHALVEKAKELGLNFLVGNSHAQEIFENGIPLAKALKNHLPGVEVYLLQERITATPVDQFGSAAIQEYGSYIAGNFLAGS